MGWLAPRPSHPVRGVVEVPGSKSETNRALVLAALADGPSTVTGALDSRDSALMIDALRSLGVGIEQLAPGVLRVVPPAEFVAGATIDCGLAGTVMRFVPPIAALARGLTRFVGDEAASARPMAPLLDCLAQLGASVDADRVPFAVDASSGLVGRSVTIDAHASSQFITGPLLAAARFPRGLELRHEGSPLPSRPHIDMTVEMLRSRGVEVAQPDANTWTIAPGPIRATDAAIDPDLTNAAVFLAAAMVTRGEVTIPRWPTTTTQPGALFLDIAERFGARVSRDVGAVTVQGPDHLTSIDVDLSAASELTPIVAALALFADGTTSITGVAHIRGHETDRLAALATEFSALGARVRETPTGLAITGVGLHGTGLRGGVFGCYADHRIAHAGALVGLVVPGILLDDVASTSKTMPEFPRLWSALCGA